MVSYSWVSLSKDDQYPPLYEFEGRAQFEVFEKLMSVWFYKLLKKPAMLLNTNIHEQITQKQVYMVINLGMKHRESLFLL